eukprot:11582-Heterococcus_DN1.PRE.1
MAASAGTNAVSAVPVAAAERRSSALLLRSSSPIAAKHTTPTLQKLGSPKHRTGSKTARSAAAAEPVVSQPVAVRRMTVRLMSGSTLLAATTTHTGATSHTLKTAVYRVMVARHRRRASANPNEVLSLLRLASLHEKQCHWKEAADWWERCAAAVQRVALTTTVAANTVDAAKQQSQHLPKARLHAVWRRCGWCRFRSWQCCSDTDVRVRCELLKQAHTAYTHCLEHVKFDVALQSVIGRDEVVQFCIRYEHVAIAMVATLTCCVLLCACSSCIAMKGALAVYQQIVTTLSFYPKYTEVLLRAATVMSHLCTLRNAPVQKLAKTASKYIDAFRAIQTQQHKEVPDHVLLLYAQVCEAQGSDSAMQKSTAARETVFLHKKAALKAAHKRLKKPYKTAAEWYKAPETQLELAKDAVVRGDSVIAAHYYKQALKQPVPTPAAATATADTATTDTAATVTASTDAAIASDKNEQECIPHCDCCESMQCLMHVTDSDSTIVSSSIPPSVSTVSNSAIGVQIVSDASYEDLMSAAEVFIGMQQQGSSDNTALVVQLLSAALQLKPFDLQARTLLCSISESSDVAAAATTNPTMQLVLHHAKEESIARKLQKRWRLRIWGTKAHDKYLAMCIQQWEVELSANHYDLHARSQLAYFAKRIYRPLFLHEEAVIRKLQAFVRACLFTKRWYLANRAHHLRKLSLLHKQLLLQPYNGELRHAVKQSCSDSYTPMHHDVRRHYKLHIQQDKAVVVLQRAYARHAVRQQARRQLQQIELQRIRRLHAAATAIQGCSRRWRARKRTNSIKLAKQRMLKAVHLVQRVWRNRSANWRWHIKHIKAKQAAEH